MITKRPPKFNVYPRWFEVRFGTFPIYQMLPEIIDLWGLNTQTDVTAKKNSPAPKGK